MSMILQNSGMSIKMLTVNYVASQRNFNFDLFSFEKKVNDNMNSLF